MLKFILTWEDWANGALGAGATAMVTPAIAEQIAKLDVSDGLKDALTFAAGAAAGGAVGGQAGAVAGVNEVANNYLKHAREGFKIPSEQARFDTAVAKCNGGDSGACSTRDQLIAPTFVTDHD